MHRHIQVLPATPSDIPTRAHLEHAIKTGKFTLETEAIVEIGSGRIFAEEALIRLHHNGGLIYPRDFIGTLEESDLISRMDMLVFERVMGEKRQTIDIPLCVNISARTLSCVNTSTEILNLIKQQSLDTSRLVVEVTETATIHDMEYAKTFLLKLKEVGVRIAIDDFGAGNASWRYLKYLPVDFIKIDGQFVRDIAKNRRDWTLLRAMTNMANTLGKEVIAEWVESKETYGMLLATGIRYAQGYFVQEARVSNSKR